MPVFYKYLIAALLSLGMALPALANKNPDRLIERAQEQAEAGDLLAAQSTLQEVVETAPSSLAYTRLGGVHLLQQAYSTGIKHFQQAIMLDQSNSKAFVGLAVAYLHMGRYQLAREALKQAEQLDPEKKQEIEKVLTWLNQRSSQDYGH
ncbi:tetratricopeptide repeat protein [Candidatus Thiodiazotropha sp. CDECU1]|uniref:tetratricopeptide repeat protein n=1 Tax=Candidatus Thiodiazotropha sp. CDECU1 TaxID=3065865 RepID=UPI0029303DF9|nr:tetratricopeptide repeat protein [Candidatus Thiodiazotropha sp. CDECU1]